MLLFYRLSQYGMERWLLLENEDEIGGQAGSLQTPEGFRFNHGYKTLTDSNYDYFDRLLNRLYPSQKGDKGLKEISRNSYVYIQGNLIPYPIQNNIKHLPKEQKLLCALDLVRTKLERIEDENNNAPKNLDEYLTQEFGDSLSNLFFRPYIYKAWMCPTVKLSHDWASSKLPSCDLVQEMKRLMVNGNKDSSKFIFKTAHPYVLFYIYKTKSIHETR